MVNVQQIVNKATLALIKFCSVENVTQHAIHALVSTPQIAHHVPGICFYTRIHQNAFLTVLFSS